jgi:hypothetical protein
LCLRCGSPRSFGRGRRRATRSGVDAADTVHDARLGRGSFPLSCSQKGRIDLVGCFSRHEPGTRGFWSPVSTIVVARREEAHHRWLRCFRPIQERVRPGSAFFLRVRPPGVMSNCRTSASNTLCETRSPGHPDESPRGHHPALLESRARVATVDLFQARLDAPAATLPACRTHRLAESVTLTRPVSARRSARRPHWPSSTERCGARLTQHPIGLRELAHDLLRRVPLPRCQCPRRAFLPTSWAARLSLDLDQPAGVRPRT